MKEAGPSLQGFARASVNAECSFCLGLREVVLVQMTDGKKRLLWISRENSLFRVPQVGSTAFSLTPGCFSASKRIERPELAQT